MISPIKLGNTNFSYNQASLFEETKDHSAYFHEEGANLSGYKAGRAMFYEIISHSVILQRQLK